MNYLGNSTSISGDWVDGKFIGECSGQLTVFTENSQPIEYDYDKVAGM